MEQRSAVAGEAGRGGAADRGEGFRILRHPTEHTAAIQGWKARRDRVCSESCGGSCWRTRPTGRVGARRPARWFWPASRPRMCAGRCARMTRKATRCSRRPAASGAARAGPTRVAGDPGARCDTVRPAVSPGAGAPTPGSSVLDDDDGVRRAQRLALAVRAEAHRMRTLLRFLPVEEAASRRYLGWYRAGALRAGGECAADRAALPEPAVLRSSRPTAARTGTGTELRFSPRRRARDAVADDAALQSWWAEHSRPAAATVPRGNRHPGGGGPG